MKKALLAGILLLVSLGASAQVKTSVDSALIGKCRILFGKDPAHFSNDELYRFAVKWVGTPYRYGGLDERGIDCSGVTRELYRSVYYTDIPRSSRDIYALNELQKIKDKNQLKEGDLLFFKTRGSVISHVAVYLHDGKFLSADRSGVQIDNLDEAYWKSRFVCGGRLLATAVRNSLYQLSKLGEEIF